MKTAILTYHDGLNHGAYLQAYCMMITLRQLGHEPVIINYKNREHWLKEDVRPWLAYRRPIRFLDHFQKRKAFKRDHQLMTLTEYTRDPEKVKRWPFDAVVIGSDVVWDTNIFGYDSLYFGNLNTDRCIAYAASCGTADFEGDVESGIQEGLNRFHSISVRDQNTRSMVKVVTGIDPQIVLDPVFLPEHIDELTANVVVPQKPYVAIYGSIYAEEDGKFIVDFAHKRGFELISVGSRNFWADRSVLTVGPLSIMSWIKNAEFVFSSTFHGTIFALRSEKQFAVRIHRGIENKVNSLLRTLELPERGAEQLQSLGESISADLDYNRVNRILQELREDSLDFLKGALS